MAASQIDLTNLADVKAWLKVTGTADDPVIQRLITQGSRLIFDYIQRSNPCLKTTFTDVYDGRDQSHMFLANWPVLSVSQVIVDGVTIQPSPLIINGLPSPDAPGWRLSGWDGYPPGTPQAVELIGYRYSRGRQNIQITYVAGYVQSETATVPGSPYQITVAAVQGPWNADAGVTYALSGIVLVKVPSAPAVGQYSVASPGVYTFNAADAGQSVAITYSYVPGTLENAAIEWVSERYRYRDRIGQKSVTIGGQQTSSYDNRALSDTIQLSLQQYKNVVPL